MLNGNSMYFYVFWELIYFYVICIYVIWETTVINLLERLIKVLATLFKVWSFAGSIKQQL